MSSLVPILYYGGFTVLFFFWVYGIVSFALDLKNKIVPTVRAYRRGRASADDAGVTDRSDVPETDESDAQGTDPADDRTGLY